MGLLVDGQWQDKWYDTEANGGRFQREDAGFRNWVTVDGNAGPTGIEGFKAEPDRYHLYVSLACPWAHRALIYSKLKGLEDIIPISVVHPFMGEYGWTFVAGEGVIADPNIHANYAYELYIKAKPDYTGRVTVPILWDKKTNTIVSNESSEIIRMFNSAFDGVGSVAGNFVPAELLTEIDDINTFVYSTINNGVYKTGFSTTQEAYEEAVVELFAALDTLEGRLATQRYLVGSTITEADWRLFTTLVRFDAVYVGHFKCNLRRIVDYPNLWGYLRDLYQVPGIAETVNMVHIKQHYYTSHASINPTRIVPVGPVIDFTTAHDREQL
ncbi:glutathione S-transferase family protein [Psychrobacter sp. NG27]|uniref:glutathione S-transferase family protein n=1 Tax=Psychrobacter sp. NG27 TaxID=2781966 RepID=UPI0018DF3D41|nr:glutathione S-transferase family protein [Psychrobacter sp. NG27]MBI0427280.1 glutathione S-transferase family protein [Psychrobacter sp. NG27]